MHGGMSTGAKTAEDIERIRKARTKHGRYSAASIARRRAARQAIRGIRALLRSACSTEVDRR
jgi:HEAT repeat protein